LFVDQQLAGQDHYALVIGSDTMSRTVSRLDRNTAIMFADGAGAVVLGTQASGCIRSSWLRTQYSSSIQLDTEFKRGHDYNPDERIPKNFIYQEAKAVLRYAPRVMHEALSEALRRADLTVHDLDYLITHQANQRMVQKVAELAQIDISKVHRSGERYGNTSAATHPVALDELSRAGKIRRGSLIALTSFGAGITWGACILEW
jgi:3-oxoacyl-[acyl-carrier-protein] synthase III